MRHIVFSALLLAALFIPSALAAPTIENLPGGRTYVQDRFPNGLEVSIVSDPSLELVATQIWYHVGSADEDDGSRGVAHLFEHLMFGPTEEHEKDAVFRFHHRHGGNNNAYTSFDETVYVSQVAPPHHVEVLKLEAARMGGLRLTQEELENEQRIVTEELRVSTENDPFTRVMVTALKSVLGDHPYALTPLGTKEDIAAATLESCFRFYDAWYHPGNAHVIVAGPVDPLATLREIREIFGGLEQRETTRNEVPAILGMDLPEEIVLKEDLPPVETAIQFYPVPAMDHPDADALSMLQTMLTGQANPFREDLVRDRGKGLEAGMQTFINRRGGAIGFYAAQLPYRRKNTSFRQIEKSLDAVAASLTEERLESARRRVLALEYRSRSWASSLASGVGRASWHRGDSREAFQRVERLQAVTLADVRRVWRTYIEDAEPVRLYIKPERVPFLIRAFGWLYPVVN
jgi:zinc protease